MGAIKNLVTGRDNQTHDVARVIILVNAILLVPVLLLGVGFYLYGYLSVKPFDIQSFFTAVLTYEGGVGALMTSGAAAIFFKRTTEPDGSQTTVESITKGEQPNITRVTKTNVIAEPGSTIISPQEVNQQ